MKRPYAACSPAPDFGFRYASMVRAQMPPKASSAASPVDSIAEMDATMTRAAANACAHTAPLHDLPVVNLRASGRARRLPWANQKDTMGDASGW